MTVSFVIEKRLIKFITFWFYCIKLDKYSLIYYFVRAFVEYFNYYLLEFIINNIKSSESNTYSKVIKIVNDLKFLIIYLIFIESMIQILINLDANQKKY